jgi:hypothetical protein
MKGSVFGGILFDQLDSRFGPPTFKLDRCYQMQPPANFFRKAWRLRIWNFEWLLMYGKPLDSIR